MQTLSLPNYKSNNVLQTSRLSVDAPAASPTLSVENNAGFSAGDFFIAGPLASETSELLAVGSTTTRTTITPTAPTAFGHSTAEAITKLFGSQLKIYRAPDVNGLAPTSGFTPLATVNIQVDQSSTLYTDPDGGSGYWYAFTYFNSTTSAETSLDPSSAVRGGNIGEYCSVEDIRGEAGFKYAPYITDDMIDAKRRAAQNEINSTLAPYYTVPFATPIPDMVSDICKRLAAGLLLVEQYGQMNSRSTVDGQARIDNARADLQKLVHPEEGGAALVDATGKSIALPNPNTSATGWPNADTATTDTSSGGAPRYFRMGMVDGYRSRDF